jgi:hypothetical protein
MRTELEIGSWSISYTLSILGRPAAARIFTSAPEVGCKSHRVGSLCDYCGDMCIWVHGHIECIFMFLCDLGHQKEIPYVDLRAPTLKDFSAYVMLPCMSWRPAGWCCIEIKLRWPRHSVQIYILAVFCVFTISFCIWPSFWNSFLCPWSVSFRSSCGGCAGNKFSQFLFKKVSVTIILRK